MTRDQITDWFIDSPTISSNVMLGSDNLACIMDFGLACSICEDEPEERIVMSEA